MQFLEFVCGATFIEPSFLMSSLWNVTGHPYDFGSKCSCRCDNRDKCWKGTWGKFPYLTQYSLILLSSLKFTAAFWTKIWSMSWIAFLICSFSWVNLGLYESDWLHLSSSFLKTKYKLAAWKIWWANPLRISPSLWTFSWWEQ